MSYLQQFIFVLFRAAVTRNKVRIIQLPIVISDHFFGKECQNSSPLDFFWNLNCIPENPRKNCKSIIDGWGRKVNKYFSLVKKLATLS